MKKINSVKSMVFALNSISGLTAKENQPLFGAKNGSQMVLEVTIANMMEGKAHIPATYEQFLMGIAQTTETFSTSNSAQIQHKKAGRTLDGLDTVKTAGKIALNIKYLAGLESGANGARWKKAIRTSQPNADIAAVEAIFQAVLPDVSDAVKMIKKAAGKRLHSLESIDHAERSFFLTEKVVKEKEKDIAWTSIE